jgi:uncharacterized membrane protein YfcA
MKKINKNALLLLISSGINNVIGLFINTFLVAYLLQLNSDNIVNISLFYIIVYAIIGILYFLLSMQFTKRSKVIFLESALF